MAPKKCALDGGRGSLLDLPSGVGAFKRGSERKPNTGEGELYKEKDDSASALWLSRDVRFACRISSASQTNICHLFRRPSKSTAQELGAEQYRD
jgi:hypothetical protein